MSLHLWPLKHLLSGRRVLGKLLMFKSFQQLKDTFPGENERSFVFCMTRPYRVFFFSLLISHYEEPYVLRPLLQKNDKSEHIFFRFECDRKTNCDVFLFASLSSLTSGPPRHCFKDGKFMVVSD